MKNYIVDWDDSAHSSALENLEIMSNHSESLKKKASITISRLDELPANSERNHLQCQIQQRRETGLEDEINLNSNTVIENPTFTSKDKAEQSHQDTLESGELKDLVSESNIDYISKLIKQN